METTVRRILETLGVLRDAVAAWWTEVAGAGAWQPELGPWLLALVLLLALAAMRRRRPPALEVRPPQLLITQGEVVPDPTAAAAPRRRRRAADPAAEAGELTMTVSNLGRYPVQLLEVALRQESRGAPRVVELDAVVPALAAVDVVARMPLGLSGDGWLDLYCYAAAPRHKLHRHRAELVWEPWVARFKVAPMEQSTAPARNLASEDRRAILDLPEPVPMPEPSEEASPRPTSPAMVPAEPPPSGARKPSASVPPATPLVAPAPLRATPPIAEAPAAAAPKAAPPTTPEPSSSASRSVAPAAPAPPAAAVPAAAAPTVAPPAVAVPAVAPPVTPVPPTPAAPVGDTQVAPLGALWAKLARADAGRTPATAPGATPEERRSAVAPHAERGERAARPAAAPAPAPERADRAARPAAPVAPAAGPSRAAAPTAPAVGRPRAAAPAGATAESDEKTEAPPAASRTGRRPRLEFPDDF